MITALSCLTLEIYYRYLPLYKVDAEDNGAAGAVAAPAAKDAKGADAKGAAGKDSKDAKGRGRQGFQRQGFQGLQGREEGGGKERSSSRVGMARRNTT